MEEHGLIDLVARERVTAPAPARPVARSDASMAIAQHDHGPRVGNLFAAGQRAGELDRHRELTVPAHRFARTKLDRRRLLMAEDHSLEKTEVIDAADQQAPGCGAARPRPSIPGSGRPARQGARRSRAPPAQEAIPDRHPAGTTVGSASRSETDARADADAAGVGLGRSAARAARGSATTTTSTPPLPSCRASSTTSFAPASSGMSDSPSCSNIGLSASVTIPPAHGPQLNETTRQLLSSQRLLLRPLVEVLVRRGISDLAGPAEPSRRRRE